MARIKICDLCGKPIQGEPQKNYCRKIKQRWSSWLESGWETIDVHEECVKKLCGDVLLNYSAHTARCIIR